MTSTQFNRSGKKTHRSLSHFQADKLPRIFSIIGQHQFCILCRRPGYRSIEVIFSYFKTRRYLRRINALHNALGIAGDYGEARQLAAQLEAARLVSIGHDIFQREQFMAPEAARAWQLMKENAANEGVLLQVVSAYRSVDYQDGIIRRKLDKGQEIEDILRVSAAPGYSEHHSGRAVDVTTPGAAVLEESFEETDAFTWLSAHACRFGFHLSFPRGNPHAVAYEPWHWAWRE